MKFISVKDYCKLMENLGTPITRHEVYAKIKSGELNAKKGPKNAWLVEDPIKPMETTWLTTKEYAEKYGLNVRKVINDCANGTLNAVKEKGKWKIADQVTVNMKDLNKEVSAIDVTEHSSVGVKQCACEECKCEDESMESAIRDILKPSDEMIAAHLEASKISGFASEFVLAEGLNIIGSYIARSVAVEDLTNFLAEVGTSGLEYVPIDYGSVSTTIEVVKGMLEEAGSKVTIANKDSVVKRIVHTYNCLSSIEKTTVLDKWIEDLCKYIEKCKNIKKSVRDKIIAFVKLKDFATDFVNSVSYDAMKELYYKTHAEDKE